MTQYFLKHPILGRGEVVTHKEDSELNGLPGTYTYAICANGKMILLDYPDLWAGATSSTGGYRR